VTVKIKWADFQQSTRSRSVASVVNSKPHLHEVSLELIRSVFPPEKGIRLVGVTLSNFTPTTEAVPASSLPLEPAS
jgi:DNA polymerase IV